ncbi:metal-dependent hydrolase [Erythrobacter sp. JK5]|uniref:metal-dependent hydrolase n=1 Tax=Erythrobacter sp. JK5 TaxID=2829500 RepID=UPI001BAACBC2|nr:metal-dependent hydrolase [Erythrobacter sp. JK5]QUL38820.1 metal-dependent hydrolase [Erythrobacter sp. JK5]
MFIGHFAPAFVAAAVSPSGPKLGGYFIAAQLVDWGFFTFAIMGIERMRIDPGATVMVPFDLYHMPFTHSLLGTGIWALGLALIVLIWHRNALAGLLAGLVVLSHWALDWLTHRPDLTLAGGPERYGLGLWNLPYIAMPLELGITLGAFVFYMRRTRGPIGPPLILIGVLLAFQAINWFGPAPAQAGLAIYIQALLAFAMATGFAVWVGENRYFVQRGGLASSTV